VPFEANDVQLEFVRIDPFVRKNLGHKSKLPSQSYSSGVYTLSYGNIGMLIYKHSMWTLRKKCFSCMGNKRKHIHNFNWCVPGFVIAESNRCCILQLYVVKMENVDGFLTQNIQI